MSILLLLANTAATERQEQTLDCERPPAPSEFPPGPNLPRPRSQLTLEVKPLAAPSQEGQLVQEGQQPGASALCVQEGPRVPQPAVQATHPSGNQDPENHAPAAHPWFTTVKGTAGFWRQ